VFQSQIWWLLLKGQLLDGVEKARSKETPHRTGILFGAKYRFETGLHLERFEIALVLFSFFHALGKMKMSA
jgi:hypothetical protein